MNHRRALFVFLIGCLAGSAASSLPGAQITVINTNAAGVGFNDPTPATPVGGNTGTTVGQQRLIAFQYAADFWSALLTSDVEIRIQASFTSLSCTATSGVLGSAGPIQVESDFPNAPFPKTWYVVALANKRAGMDLEPGATNTDADDIRARFNSELGTTNCLDGFGWYYGIDNNHGDQVDLVNTLLHEFGHGLGFLTLVDVETGAEQSGQPDSFERRILDTTAGLFWDEMTDSQRATSAKNALHVVWGGPNVKAEAPTYLNAGTPVLDVLSPASIAGEFNIGVASFGPAISTPGITGTLVQALDPSDASGAATTDACSPLTNASVIAGNIALVDRGTCTFVVKVKNAQNAGATAVLIADNAVGNPPAELGGTDDTITIPAVRITQADGNTLKANLAANVQIALKLDPTRLAGADGQGRVYLYATDPIIDGSTIVHWDSSATPDLLMEPNDSSTLRRGVDLTLPALLDMGWGVIADRDFDGVPDVLDNCPDAFNPAQADANHNGVGDACERLPELPVARPGGTHSLTPR